MDNILEKIYKVAERVFKQNKNVFSPKSSANNIDTWDSLAHAIFLAEIEKSFEIQFDIMDMIQIQTIGDVAEKIQTHQK